MINSAMAQEKKSISEILKYTLNNWQGHKDLFNKGGWKIIPSAQKSLEYCQKKTIGPAKLAWMRWRKEIPENSKKYLEALKSNPSKVKEATKIFNSWANSFRKNSSNGTTSISNELFNYSKFSTNKTFEHLLLGTIHIGKRNKKEWLSLKSIPGNWLDSVNGDFNRVKEWATFLKSKKKKNLESTWSNPFIKAQKEFNKEYEKSKKKEYSFQAIPSILLGHAKALWYGIIKPIGLGTKTVGKKSLKLIGKLIVFPATMAVMATGRTIMSVGAVVYYPAKMGVNIVSENIYAGLFAAISLISASAIVPTWVTGQAIGVAGQIAITGAGIAGGLGHAALATTAQTAKYSGQLLYNVGKETGKVIVGVGMSGVVLGYNALTSLPAQLILGAANTVFFMAWDGPRLGIYSAQGKIKGEEIDQIPVGSVVDLEKLKQKGIQVKKISQDTKVIDKVLRKLPLDFIDTSKQ